MGGAYYILLINVALGALVMVSLFGIWLYDRSRPAPALLAGATLLFLAGGGMELLAPALPQGELMAFRLTLQIVNFAACVLLTVGVRAHYGLPSPAKVLVFFVLVSIALFVLVIDWPRQSALRIAINQVPLALALAMSPITLVLAAVNRTIRKLGILDKVLIVATAAFALNVAARPALFWLYGTMGENPALYHTTQYALVSQFALAIITMTSATVLLLVLVADLVEDLRAQSDTDPLTGMLNRRGFDRAARTAFSRIKRTREPFSLVMVDIDHFKQVNDTYGHPAGDRIISFLGWILREEARGSDFVARLGGEEFAVGLWGTRTPGACNYAEVRRIAFEQGSRGLLSPDRHCTASFGIAERIAGESMTDLMRRADGALYRAKREGRNRLVAIGFGIAADGGLPVQEILAEEIARQASGIDGNAPTAIEHRPSEDRAA